MASIEKVDSKTNTDTIKVENGDCVYDIAKQFGISPEEIMNLGNNPDLIFAGDEFEIPKSTKNMVDLGYAPSTKSEFNSFNNPEGCKTDAMVRDLTEVPQDGSNPPKRYGKMDDILPVDGSIKDNGNNKIVSCGDGTYIKYDPNSEPNENGKIKAEVYDCDPTTFENKNAKPIGEYDMMVNEDGKVVGSIEGMKDLCNYEKVGDIDAQDNSIKIENDGETYSVDINGEKYSCSNVNKKSCIDGGGTLTLTNAKGETIKAKNVDGHLTLNAADVKKAKNSEVSKDKTDYEPAEDTVKNCGEKFKENCETNKKNLQDPNMNASKNPYSLYQYKNGMPIEPENADKYNYTTNDGNKYTACIDGYSFQCTNEDKKNCKEGQVVELTCKIDGKEKTVRATMKGGKFCLNKSDVGQIVNNYPPYKKPQEF